MRKFSRRAALIVAAGWLVLAGTAIAMAQAASPLNGDWLFNVVTEGGAGTPTVTFKVDGQKLTGHYSSETFGEQDITGEAKDKAFTFKFPVEGIGEVTYQGTLEADGTLKGTLNIPMLGGGTFTAKKK